MIPHVMTCTTKALYSFLKLASVLIEKCNEMKHRETIVVLLFIFPFALGSSSLILRVHHHVKSDNDSLLRSYVDVDDGVVRLMFLFFMT